MARCSTPFVKNGVPCPCGKCDNCRKTRASQWAFRIKQEADQLGSAFFITLTYSNENNPMKYEINPKPIRETWKLPYYAQKHKRKRTKQPVCYQPTILPTVDIKHLQRFMKRLRKRNHAKKIKIYGVSEYGSETKRPHYHIILLGADIVSLVGLENFKQIEKGNVKLDGQTQLILPDWKFGHATIGKVNEKTISYTLKYISKGRIIPQFARDNRQKEKSVMSKNLGLGYLTEQQIKYHKQNPLAQYVVNSEGHKIALPRYYREKLFDDQDKAEISEIFALNDLRQQHKMSEAQLQKLYKSRQNNEIDKKAVKSKSGAIKSKL